MKEGFTTETQSTQRWHRVSNPCSVRALCVLCVSVVNLTVPDTQRQIEPLREF